MESTAYSFGQSHDRPFLKSLARTPAYFTRLLAGGRRGLTRVFEGKPDDNNRPTLLLITAIVSQPDWDAQLCGDVGLLLDAGDLWKWDGTAAIAPMDLLPPPPLRAVPKKSVSRLLALISEIERAYASRRGVMVSQEDYSLADLRAIEMLVPPPARRQVTTAYRGLSVQLPVSVNCLATEAPLQGRTVFRPQGTSAGMSPYAATLLSGGLGTSGVVPIEWIAECRTFGIPERGSAGAQSAAAPVMATASMHGRSGSMWPAVFTGALGMALAAGTFFAGRSIGKTQTIAIERESQNQQQHELEAAHKRTQAAALAEQEASYTDRLRKRLDLSTGSYDELLAAAAAKVDQSAIAVKGSEGARADVAGQRDKLRTFYDAEFARQRARFAVLKSELHEIAGADGRRLADNQRSLKYISEEIQGLNDDWPLAPAAEQAWIGELREVRARLPDLASTASNLARVLQLLDSAESAMRHARGVLPSDASLMIETDLAEARDTVAALPGKLEKSGTDLSSFKKNSGERAARLRKWLDEQSKERSKAAANASKPPDPK